MTTWDSADLNARCRRYAAHPSTQVAMLSTDASVTASWYELLTEAQDHWLRQFAVHFPWTLGWVSGTLTSDDGGETYIIGTHTTLSRGSTDTRVASTAFQYIIGSSLYSKATVTAGTALAAGTIPSNTWGIYLFSVNAAGTITSTAGAANFTTGYATEALALAALPATPASTVAIGYITVLTKVGSAFVGGTDGLEGGSSGNVSSDTNYYSVLNSTVQPLSIEVYDSKTGRFLVPGWYPDPGADYVWEGDRLRIPRGGTRSFSSGPFVRFIAPGTTLSATVEPILKPDYARILIVYRALILYAERGGMHEVGPYQRLEDRAWFGDPARGDGGLLLQLKQANPFAGAAAFPSANNIEGLAYIQQVGGYSSI